MQPRPPHIITEETTMIMLKSLERTPNLAELKVSYRRGRGRDSNQLTMPFIVTSPITAEQYLRSVWDNDTLELREEFILVCLNTANEVLGWVKLATGGMDTTPIDPRLLFGVALQVAATGIIIAHNHPSGSVEPSKFDQEVTKRLKAGAKLLGIRLLDHLIVGRDKSFSFSQAGLLTS